MNCGCLGHGTQRPLLALDPAPLQTEAAREVPFLKVEVSALPDLVVSFQLQLLQVMAVVVQAAADQAPLHRLVCRQVLGLLSRALLPTTLS